ncbi:hypothetical protein CVT25_014332 [Psilocybe cyanescens]|uniref:Fungal-type protein kinase domain-containing protein n=1 Tax=Psilocybe cyanescens TaxID=93625 RepID=A0A409XL26_PSICY|nr:hypothetical protein CVT25_014332 [Psilocybe cyanescens]
MDLAWPGRNIAHNIASSIEIDRFLKSSPLYDYTSKWWRGNKETRAFQLTSVLQNCDKTLCRPPHDYLDDLESFFYILCWLAIGHAGSSKKVDPFPNFPLRWESPDPTVASSFKQNMFILNFPQLEDISPFFGTVLSDLLIEYRKFLKPYTLKKINDTISRKPPASPVPTLLHLQKQATGHYEAALKFFDETIQQY